jgi:predicted AlkP superfamily pyrophosphatase or phosphodiesterase
MTRRVITLLFALATALEVVGAQTAAAPKLAVLIVVDQMRADYVDRFKDEWTGGLKRLITHGAWFTHAAYPYLTTVTCAGHATISTGAFPNVHGVFQNTWFDRTAGRNVTCTEDARAKPVLYGKDGKDGESAANLRLPTFADEMQSQRGAHVVAMSLKARSAIMLAGHGGDAVTWLTDSLQGWETSSAFTAAPIPAVKAFVAANPIDGDYGRTWARLLPAAQYRYPDAADGEAPPKGWTASFPHVLNGGAGDTKPGAEFYDQWERSPFADAYLGRFAATLTESLQLGRHDGTDVLAISFSTPDLVGHAFGPRSQEVQDIYAQLDRTIGILLDRLDTIVGHDAYVVALTADHGVTELPEQAARGGLEGGRLESRRIADAIQRRAQAAVGPGTYVARVNGNDVYFERGMLDKLSSPSSALEAVIDAIRSLPGVGRVFRADALRNGASSSDPLLRAAALSYVPGRSGDLVIVPKTGWMFASTGTTHGTASLDDQQVPIILFGRNIKAGRYAEAATPADIAPTLAAICGITMPRADGRVLRAALTGVPVQSPTSRP